MIRESRVTRILRDARAAVGAAPRPETPRGPARGVQLEPLRVATPPEIRQTLRDELEALRHGSSATCSIALTSVRQQLEDGSISVESFRTAAGFDALVRALERCADADGRVNALGIIRDLLRIDETIATQFFTAGILQVLNPLLSDHVHETTTANIMIILKLLSSSIGHHFSRFGLVSTVVDAASRHVENEVITTMAIATLSRVVDESTPAEVEERIVTTSLQLLAVATSPFAISRLLYLLQRGLEKFEGAISIVLRKGQGTLLRTMKEEVAPLSEIGLELLLHVLAPISCDDRTSAAFRQSTLSFAVRVGEVTERARCRALSLMVISNLTFHDVDTSLVQDELADVILGVLFGADVEPIVEATRSLGNISRSDAGKQFCRDHRLDEVIITLAEHHDQRIVYNCLGCLINLSMNSTTRERVKADLNADAVTVAANKDADIMEVWKALQANLENLDL